MTVLISGPVDSNGVSSCSTLNALRRTPSDPTVWSSDSLSVRCAAAAPYSAMMPATSMQFHPDEKYCSAALQQLGDCVAPLSLRFISICSSLT